jgi:hypothetical protein
VRQQDPTLDITAGQSKRKSSAAESEAPTDDARRMIEGGPGYPVDGIKESTSCELHQRIKNISMKVAVGCRGDDLGGAPWARQHADWRPRSLYVFSTRRPAPPEGLAALAAGWRLHRGELEPGDEDKASQWLSGQKYDGPDKSGRGAGQE